MHLHTKENFRLREQLKNLLVVCMYKYVCMYVCMYVCVYVCMCVYIYTCIYIHYVCTYTWQAAIFIYIYIYIYIYTHIMYLHTHGEAATVKHCMHTCIRIYIHT